MARTGTTDPPTHGLPESREEARRWAGLEGWWIVAGILALLFFALLKAMTLA